MFKKTLMASVAALTLFQGVAQAVTPAELNDLEIAHVAYTADNIDIRYAYLALALSDNPAIKEFANTMIRDHTIVNEKALALLAKLEANPQDNFLTMVRQMEARDIAEGGHLDPPRRAPRGAEIECALDLQQREYIT